MPGNLILTLLASIAVHAVVAYQLIYQTKDEQHTISMGTVKAPIRMTFSTVTMPEPEPQPEPGPKPEEQPPEPEPEPPEPEKDVVVIPDPLPEPESEPEEKIIGEEIPEPVIEEQIVESALEETEVEGLSDEPVFVSEPEIMNWTRPRYPRSAQRRNQQGLVMLEVMVDEGGHAMTVSVIESSGFDALDKSAIAAVQSWSFKPRKRNNTFVQSRVHVPVVFQLN